MGSQSLPPPQGFPFPPPLSFPSTLLHSLTDPLSRLTGDPPCQALGGSLMHCDEHNTILDGAFPESRELV